MEMMVMTSAARCLLLLNVLLQRREIRLRRREIAGIQVLSELRDGLRYRIAGLRAALRGVGGSLQLAGQQLLKGREFALRLRQIAGPEILTELLKPLLNLLKLVLT